MGGAFAHEPLVMTSPDLLQHLHRLDRSSSRFQDQLNNVLYGKEYKPYVDGLQNDDLVGLVDYLDKVRCYVPLPHLCLS